MKNQMLREKSDKKVGGQQWHEGKTLECSATIDKVVDHVVNYCNCCGQDLTGVPETIIDTRQVIDILVIKPVYIEHRVYRKTSSCRHNIESDFPAHLVAKVQYVANVESLIGYNMPVSEARLTNFLGEGDDKLLGRNQYLILVRPQQIVTIRLKTQRNVGKIQPLKDWSLLVPENKRELLMKYDKTLVGHPESH